MCHRTSYLPLFYDIAGTARRSSALFGREKAQSIKTMFPQMLSQPLPPAASPPPSVFSSPLALVQCPPLLRHVSTRNLSQLVQEQFRIVVPRSVMGTQLLRRARRAARSSFPSPRKRRISQRYFEDRNLAVFLTPGQEQIISNCP